jgi:hypothetical protein
MSHAKVEKSQGLAKVLSTIALQRVPNTSHSELQQDVNLFNIHQRCAAAFG